MTVVDFIWEYVGIGDNFPARTRAFSGKEIKKALLSLVVNEDDPSVLSKYELKGLIHTYAVGRYQLSDDKLYYLKRDNTGKLLILEKDW